MTALLIYKSNFTTGVLLGRTIITIKRAELLNYIKEKTSYMYMLGGESREAFLYNIPIKKKSKSTEKSANTRMCRIYSNMSKQGMIIPNTRVVIRRVFLKTTL